MNQPIWVLVNCNSLEEAKNIGDAVLKARLISCYDVFRREVARYFWPPRSGKIEEAKGALLIMETFEDKYQMVKDLATMLHSDKLPFIGFVKIEGVDEKYIDWMRKELK